MKWKNEAMTAVEYEEVTWACHNYSAIRLLLQRVWDLVAIHVGEHKRIGPQQVHVTGSKDFSSPRAEIIIHDGPH